MELTAYIGRSVDVGVFIPEDDDSPTDVLVIIGNECAAPNSDFSGTGSGIETECGVAEVCRRYSIG